MISGSANRTVPVYAEAITPSNTANLNQISTIYCGGAGDIKVDTEGGNTVTFKGFLASIILPVSVKKVYATGTTATNLLATW